MTAEMLQACLARMRCWCRLAREVVQHEFPNWDVMQTFEIFNVKHTQRAASSETREKHCKRLARFLGLDEVAFRSELEDLWPLAHVHASATKCDSPAAWRHTLQQVTSTKSRRVRHPCTVLQKALARWIGWSPSTSGVEQAFGHSTEALTARQSHCSEAFECNEMVLLLDHDPSTEPRMLELAREAACTAMTPGNFFYLMRNFLLVNHAPGVGCRLWSSTRAHGSEAGQGSDPCQTPGLQHPRQLAAESPG